MKLNKKIIKKNIVDKDSYKNNFPNRKMKLILYKISSIFETSLSNEEIAHYENLLNKDVRNIENWKKIFTKLGSSFKQPLNKCNWNEFGIYIFYVYNQFIYWNKKSDSIYNLENFNELNEKKSISYGNWLKTVIESGDIDFNIYVRKVLRLF